MKWTLLYQFFFEMGKNGYNRIILIGIFSLNENEWLLIFSKEYSFSNSGINKVAMVKNALLPMSL
jgi:hypothetical protein